MHLNIYYYSLNIVKKCEILLAIGSSTTGSTLQLWLEAVTLISSILRLDCGLYQFTDNVIIIGFFCHVLGMVTTVPSPSGLGK